MFNVYISADIEGVNGVTYPHQTEKSGGESYLLAQKQQHEEINCIIEALLEEDIDKITVNDAHGTMENLHISGINPKVEIITGKPKQISMLAGLDNSYTCLFLVGYHAMAGSNNGVLAHTFSTIFSNVKLNGNPVGEIELNSIYAGLIGVPVALITGDNVACDEATAVIGDVNTVITKAAISTTSAICKPNDELFYELKSTVKYAVNNPQDWLLYRKDAPYELELDFQDRKLADVAGLLPEVERVNSTSIIYSSDDYSKIYRMLQFFSATLSK